MKRVLALVIFVVAFAMVAHAGPYFVIESYPLTQSPSAMVTFGWDFEVPFVEASNLSVSGDFFVMNDNFWAYPTPWAGGFDLGLAWCNDAAVDVFEAGLGMDFVLNPYPWPNSIPLDEWTISVSLLGRPSSVVTIWATLDFVFEMARWTGVLDFEPMIGLECRW